MTQRYNSFAIVLHWLMALGFIGMLASGLLMVQEDLLSNAQKFQVYQIHKASGVILLLAFVVRIAWRFVSKVPSLPEHFPKIEKLAAKLGHWGLYAAMIAMPITGWVMVSASIYGLPTIVFDLFEWPHIPNLQGNEQIENLAKFAHEWIAYGFIALILAHIAAVIKHAVKDKENLLKRMWWSKS